MLHPAFGHSLVRLLLKGVGSVPPLAVDHLDQYGVWHESAAWPPPDAHNVAMPLEDAAAVLGPVVHELSLFSLAFAPGLGGGASLCTESPPGLPTISAVFEWASDEPMTIAGNPFLDLTVTSALDTGLVNASLYDVGPGFSCPAVFSPDVRWLAGGGADLQHHESRYEARPFPVGSPTRLRIDLSDITGSIPAGHRLALVLTDGDPLHLAEPGSLAGLVTIDGDASRLVVPTIG